MTTIRENYVPRRFRVGAMDTNTHRIEGRHEIVENCNVVDADGNVIGIAPKCTIVDASEDLSKYRREDFKLQNLIDAGVPLTLVSCPTPTGLQLDQISQIADKLGNLDEFAKQVESQRQSNINYYNDLFPNEDVESNVEPKNE